MGTKEDSWWNERTFIALVLVQFILAVLAFVLDDRGITLPLAVANAGVAILIVRRMRSRGLPAPRPTPAQQQYDGADLSFRHFVRLVGAWVFRSRLRWGLYMWIGTTCVFLVLMQLRGDDPGLALYIGAVGGIAAWWTHPGPPDKPPT